MKGVGVCGGWGVCVRGKVGESGGFAWVPIIC